MEALFDEADAFLANDDSRPNFAIPEEYSHIVETPLAEHAFFTVRDDPVTGRGLYAKQALPAGTTILVSKPLGIVMDFEVGDEEEDQDALEREDTMEDDDEEEAAPAEPPLNDLLLLQILKKVVDDPDLWNNTLSELYPRQDTDLSALPGYVCANDDLFLQMETLLSQIENDDTRKAVSTRLPLILRYNVLGTETAPELLSYPSSDYPDLASVALYGTASYFNHSSTPNVSRFSVGDVLFLYCNTNVQANEQLCISYIEHEVLCEPSWRRNEMLQLSRMNFLEADTNTNNADDPLLGPHTPVVDSALQNELMQSNPLQRLHDLDELLSQAKGEKPPQEEESNMQDEPNESWFQCDVHNLNILKAITLDGMGQHSKALELWQEAIHFVQDKLPPLEESMVVLLVQAAQSAWYSDQQSLGKQYAQQALVLHDTIFGGGRARFVRRLTRDLELALRPKRDGLSPVSTLWPMEAATISK